jgi:hypothetical protein
MGAPEVEPAEHHAKDISDLEDIDALLDRYQRAGRFMAEAKAFRAEIRAKIFEALAGASVGQTARWLLRIEKRWRGEYTVRERFLNYLLIAPVDDGEADDDGTG